MDRFEAKLDHAWNAGLYLRQVPKFMARFGFDSSYLPRIISGWRKRKKEFGCKCIVRERRRSVYDLEREEQYGKALCTAPMFGSTYDNWKGITGPGKRLREMIKEMRNDKST